MSPPRVKDTAKSSLKPERRHRLDFAPARQIATPPSMAVARSRKSPTKSDSANARNRSENRRTPSNEGNE